MYNPMGRKAAQPLLLILQDNTFLHSALKRLLPRIIDRPRRRSKLKHLLTSRGRRSLPLPRRLRGISNRPNEALPLLDLRNHTVNERHVLETHVLELSTNRLLNEPHNLRPSDVLRAIENVLALVKRSSVILKQEVRGEVANVVRVHNASGRVLVEDQPQRVVLVVSPSVRLDYLGRRPKHKTKEDVGLQGAPVQSVELGGAQQGLDGPVRPRVVRLVGREHVGSRGGDPDYVF